jgi:hypothetical protein
MKPSSERGLFLFCGDFPEPIFLFCFMREHEHFISEILTNQASDSFANTKKPAPFQARETIP